MRQIRASSVVAAACTLGRAGCECSLPPRSPSSQSWARPGGSSQSVFVSHRPTLDRQSHPRKSPTAAARTRTGTGCVRTVARVASRCARNRGRTWVPVTEQVQVLGLGRAVRSSALCRTSSASSHLGSRHGQRPGREVRSRAWLCSTTDQFSIVCMRETEPKTALEKGQCDTSPQKSNAL